MNFFFPKKHSRMVSFILFKCWVKEWKKIKKNFRHSSFTNIFFLFPCRSYTYISFAYWTDNKTSHGRWLTKCSLYRIIYHIGMYSRRNYLPTGIFPSAFLHKICGWSGNRLKNYNKEQNWQVNEMPRVTGTA